MANETNAILANEVNEANMANEADMANKAYNAEADEAAEAIVANEVSNIVVAIEANVIDLIVVANKADLTLLDDDIAYSLTKYCAIFAKMMEYFGMMISNNYHWIDSQSLCFRVVSESVRVGVCLGQRIISSAACVATATDNIATTAIVARLQIAKPMRLMSQWENKANKLTRAGDAKVAKADLPDETEKAKANDANKAEAYEVNEAIVANAANEANVIHKIIVANKTIVMANKTIVIDKVIAVDEAIVINEVIMVDIKHSSKLLLDDGIAVDN